MSKKVIKPIVLRGKEFPSNIFYAPLAGCSDYPFRKMIRKHTNSLMFCEMVKMEALVRNDPGTFQLLSYSADMHPIGGQLCGSSLKVAKDAAKIIEELGFDVVDLNCGCPVDKVTKDASGSGLLKHPELIADIVADIVASVRIPVTVKIRMGWDEKNLIGPHLVELVEAAGASLITVHARTREQGYRGAAFWPWIAECKARAKNIYVFGNGDIISPVAAKKIFSETNCDGIMLSRGSLGSPWLAHDIEQYIEHNIHTSRTTEEKKKALIEHLEEVEKFQVDRKVLIDMRKIGCWYFKKAKGTKAFREAVSHAQTISDIRNYIETCEIDETEGDIDEQAQCTSCG